MSSADVELCVAATSGDVAEIEREIAAGADPNAFEGTYGYTPLQRAAINDHVAAIAALLAAGARVDAVNSDGTTPLMYAAVNGHTAAIDALLAAGADVHHADRVGDTALHYASQHGHVPATSVLLDAGARTDVRTSGGDRPIDVVRAPGCSLDAAASSCHAAALPRRLAQACKFTDEANEPALRALLASAVPWSRRRPVAISCYGVEWEWGA
jgi:ankyrin repeat protein